MSKKLSFILLLSVTVLFVLAIIATLIFRTSPYSGQSASAYDQLAVSEAIADTSPVAMDGKLNINTATYDDLLQLPGIGDALAKKILEYRQAQGKFTSIDELLNISGIGSAKFDKLKDYISVGG